jgi:adhesin transport system outer membrane protein
MLSIRPVLCAVLLAGWLPSVGAETLAESVKLALSNFPEMRAAAANRSALAETAVQARGAWLPTIDANLGLGSERSNNASTRALGADQTLPRREAEVTVSQLLFDGGVTSGQVRRSEARALGAGEQVNSAAESTAGRAAQAFVEVMRLRGLLQLARDNVSRHEQTLDLVAKLANSGRGRGADTQQADARLAFAQSSLTQLRGQLVQAEAAYRHIVGQAPGVLADPGEMAARLPASLEAALALVADAHPAVRAAMRELEAAQADREAARGRAVAPRLALELGGSANRDIDGVRGASSDQFAMLRLRYNLYRGGADEARVREAEARMDEALANVSKVRNDTQRDLRQAWDTLLEDRARMPQLGRYVAASNEVVIAYRAQFSIGQRTMLDVLNAENELFTAKSSLYSGLSAITAGELRVLAAVGRLLDALGLALPAGAEAGSAQSLANGKGAARP